MASSSRLLQQSISDQRPNGNITQAMGILRAQIEAKKESGKNFDHLTPMLEIYEEIERLGNQIQTNERLIIEATGRVDLAQRRTTGHRRTKTIRNARELKGYNEEIKTQEDELTKAQHSLEQLTKERDSLEKRIIGAYTLLKPDLEKLATSLQRVR